MFSSVFSMMLQQMLFCADGGPESAGVMRQVDAAAGCVVFLHMFHCEVRRSASFGLVHAELTGHCTFMVA